MRFNSSKIHFALPVIACSDRKNLRGKPLKQSLAMSHFRLGAVIDRKRDNMESGTMNTITTKLWAGAVLACALAVSGCNSSKGPDALDVGAAPAQEKVLASDLIGFCPQVILREGTAVTTKYEKGGDGDAASIVYQGSISEVTRSCKRSDGNVSIAVGVAGKVVPGPKASGDPTSLPIRVAIVEGENVLYSELQNFQVTVVAGQAATQFVFSDPNPIIPVANIKAVQIFVGFDEGPPKPKKADEEAG
jgi:hypothetical protein